MIAVRRHALTSCFVGLLFLVSILALLCSGCRQRHVSETPAVAPVVLTVLIWAPDWQEQMLQIAAQYSRLHPQVRINVQFMIGNSVEANLKPRIASGNLPDLMSVNPNGYAATLADQGFLAEIGDTAAWHNMLTPLKGDWTSDKGRHFGIAGGLATTMIYYNEALFERAGIRKLPANYDEFLKVCAQLKAAGIVPLMWSGGYPNMLGNGPFSFGFANNVIAFEPDWREKMRSGSLHLDTPKVAAIFARLRQLPDLGYVQKNYMNTDYDDGIQLFRTGQVAMAFHGSWAAGALMHDTSFKTGIFIPPWNQPGEPIVPVLGSETGFAISDGPNQAEARQLLEFIAGAGYATLQNKRQNISPFKTSPGKMICNPQIQAYTDKVSRYPLTASPYYSVLPSNSIERLHGLMQDVLLKKITPAMAARALDQSVRHEAVMHYQ